MTQMKSENVRGEVPLKVLWKWTGVSAVLHVAFIGVLCGISYYGHLKKEEANKAKAAAEFSKQLPDGFSLKGNLQGIEAGLVAFIEDAKKPANIIDKIVEGKLGSFYAQVVLPDQASIRDPKTTVADVLAAASKALGATVTVTRFARLKVGETV